MKTKRKLLFANPIIDFYSIAVKTNRLFCLTKKNISGSFSYRVFQL